MATRRTTFSFLLIHRSFFAWLLVEYSLHFVKCINIDTQSFIDGYTLDCIKLDLIKQGVQQLNAIGTDINEELDKQAVMLDEVEQKMDKVTEKLENRNEQIKKLLDSTGGATRWCPVMILCIILKPCIKHIMYIS